MSSIKAELDALKQQHQFTVMELTDLKEDYEKIKKLNTTILENMMKEPSDALNEIKVIIDGNLYNQRIVDLQAELQRLRSRMNEEVQRRLADIMANLKKQTPKQHDCQNCEKCIKLLLDCANCKKYTQKIKALQKVLQQKTQRVDRLRLQIQQKKSQFEILQSRKNNEKSQKLNQFEQINKILKTNIADLQELVSEKQQKYKNNNRQWENEYNNLNQMYRQALQELQQYKNYIDQQQQQMRDNSQSNRKTHMVKQIQNILGQLGNRKSVSNLPPKMVKQTSNGSRMGVQDSDFTNFSIKDAINRPNQFTFY